MCKSFILTNKSVLCLRERETIKASPALASHAENVRRRMENFKFVRFFVRWDQIVIFRNKDKSSSSRHSNKDRRCRRFIIIPMMPNEKRVNMIIVSIFICRMGLFLGSMVKGSEFFHFWGMSPIVLN